MTATAKLELDRSPMPPPAAHWPNIYTAATEPVDVATRYFPLLHATIGYPHFHVDYPYTIESGAHLVAESGGIIQAQRITPGRVIIQTEPTAYTGSSLWALLKSIYYVGSSFSSVIAPTPSPMRTAAELRVERLSYIQSAFEFPIQTLAQVLQISRAQLYKWLDREKEIHLHENSRDRLIALEQIASHWLSLAKTPLSAVAYEPLPNGVNIIDLMSEVDLDIVFVEMAMRSLVDATGVVPKSITQQMHERGFKRRPSARSLPSDA